MIRLGGFPQGCFAHAAPVSVTVGPPFMWVTGFGLKPSIPARPGPLWQRLSPAAAG